MALETGTYISDLVITNPVIGDDVGQGDDHLRLVKATLKTTFPNVTGAVTPTHTQLNYVAGVTSALQTQLDAKAPLASPALTGTPTVPTATAGTNTTQIASTAFVRTEVAAGQTRALGRLGRAIARLTEMLARHESIQSSDKGNSSTLEIPSSIYLRLRS